MDNSGYAVEVESREYVNPDVSISENDQFIENLRGLQAQNNKEIATDTYNLGTPVPSNLGGLGGADATWQDRYQTPQMNELIAGLNTKTRQTALNTAMQNKLDIMKNRYSQANRNLQKAQHSYSTRGSRSGGGGSGTDSTGDNSSEDPTSLPEGDVDLNYNEDKPVTPIKVDSKLRDSLTNMVEKGMMPNGIMLWEGYKPNLSNEENFFNYLSDVARKADSGS